MKFPFAPALARTLLLSLILLLGACQPAPTQTRIQGNTMGTYYAVTLSDPFPGGQGALQQEVEALLARLNKEISTYDPGSLISRFNQDAGKAPMVIPASMARIVQQGMDAGRLTQGKLDVTVGPLVNLWGFGPDKRPVKRPTAEQITQARERVGIDKLSLTPQGDHFLLGKSIPNLYLDLSTLGEGAASDDIAALLERERASRYRSKAFRAAAAAIAASVASPTASSVSDQSESPAMCEMLTTWSAPTEPDTAMAETTSQFAMAVVWIPGLKVSSWLKTVGHLS